MIRKLVDSQTSFDLDRNIAKHLLVSYPLGLGAALLSQNA